MISSLGKKIKKLRLECFMSASNLARTADTSVSTISQIESGQRQTLKGDTIEKIAKALKVTPNQLMNDTQKMSASEEKLLNIYIDGLSEIRGELNNKGIITHELKNSLLSETIKFLGELNTL